MFWAVASNYFINWVNELSAQIWRKATTGFMRWSELYSIYETSYRFVTGIVQMLAMMLEAGFLLFGL